jgi:hypothetical protein
VFDALVLTGPAANRAGLLTERRRQLIVLRIHILVHMFVALVKRKLRAAADRSGDVIFPGTGRRRLFAAFGEIPEGHATDPFA